MIIFKSIRMDKVKCVQNADEEINVRVLQCVCESLRGLKSRIGVIGMLIK